MDICRICFSNKPEKFIHELKTSKKNDNGYNSHTYILQFCLNIQLSEESQADEKLCSKCFKKLLSFYKFKSMALRNNAHLKFLSLSNTLIDPDHEPVAETQIVTVETLLDDEINKYKSEVKIEPKTYHVDGPATNDREEIPNLDRIAFKLDTEDLGNCDVDDQCIQGSRSDYSDIEPISYKHIEKLHKTYKLKSKSTKTRRKKQETGIKKILVAPGICEQCGANVQNLKLHSVIHIPRHERQRFPCKLCSKSFITSGALKVHHKRKHLGMLSHCQLCNKDFMDIKSHQLIMHNPDKMPMECGVCHLRFPYQSALDNHMTHHTKEKAFQCENCGKSFRLKMLLNQHVRSVHEKEKNFICQHCSKSFFKKYHFLNHLRTHTKERPFKCDKCDKSFTTTSTLKDHQYLHSSVKEFHCKLCIMTFAKAGYLRKHMVSHTQERGYACRYCGARFKRPAPRNKHECDKHEIHVTRDVDHSETTHVNVNNNNATHIQVVDTVA